MENSKTIALTTLYIRFIPSPNAQSKREKTAVATTTYKVSFQIHMIIECCFIAFKKEKTRRFSAFGLMVSEGNASSFGLFIEKVEILSLELIPQSQEQLVTIVRHLGGISDIVQARVIVVHIRHKWIEVSVSGGILVSQVYREVLA